MSFKPLPWSTGTKMVLGTDPNTSSAVDLTGDDAAARGVGFLVGTLGSASPAVLTVYDLQGNLFEIKNVQAGVVYDVPIRGVHSVSAGMTDVWVMQ